MSIQQISRTQSRSALPLPVGGEFPLYPYLLKKAQEAFPASQYSDQVQANPNRLQARRLSDYIKIRVMALSERQIDETPETQKQREAKMIEFARQSTLRISENEQRWLADAVSTHSLAQQPNISYVIAALLKEAAQDFFASP